MLEKIDLKKKCQGKEYKARLEEESAKLSVLQRQCKEAGIPVIIVFEGFGAAGKGTQILFIQVTRNQRMKGCIHFYGVIGQRFLQRAGLLYLTGAGTEGY